MSQLTRAMAGAAAVAITLSACGGDGPTTDNPAAAPAPSVAAVPAAAPTGDTVVVEMITDGTGNFFKESEITVKRGDVVRFTLVAGVHDVNFVPDSNPPGVKLPATSDLLQLPGQTIDYLIDFPAGRYYYHCTPHALLGMIGHITVE
jgi:plastocyanin